MQQMTSSFPSSVVAPVVVAVELVQQQPLVVVARWS
jgi:hypothetical protein